MHAYVIDIPTLTIGDEVTIVGYVLKLRAFTTHSAVRVRDITGSVLVLIPAACTDKVAGYAPDRLRLGMRVQVTGRVQLTKQGERLVSDVAVFEVLSEPTSKLQDLDIEMREQASRMLLSRACLASAQFFRNAEFTEFEATVISRGWSGVAGLEPLHVVYPGFGAPAVLATSPAPQVMDFLTTTGAKRAFTLSRTFTTTFRHRHAGVESRALVAKAVDLPPTEHRGMLWSCSQRVLHKLDPQVADTLCPADVAWTEETTWPSDRAPPSHAAVRPVEYTVSHPVSADRWTTTLVAVCHIVAPDGSLLAEGCRERLTESLTISTLVIYPSQFLSLVKATPARHLRNLGRFNVWH